MEHVLEASGLRRRFGDVVAVDDVSLTIAEGETYGLLGPNGAGKTTTISMIAGLLVPDTGHVMVDGRSMTVTAVEAKRAIGYVPQELAVYPDLSARENLRFFGRVQGLGRATLEGRIEEVLEVVELTERGDDRVDTYSGGMKRRLNIAVGLLHRPRLLVLDEPTVGVDPQSRNAILEAVAAMSHDGTSILYTTHYMEEAERLCDRVGIIDHGRLQAEGTRRELVALTGDADLVTISGGPDGRQDAADALRDLAPVTEVVVDDQGLEVAVREARRHLTTLLEAVTSAGMAVDGVEVREPDLEAVFLHLTGRALRD